MCFQTINITPIMKLLIEQQKLAIGSMFLSLFCECFESDKVEDVPTLGGYRHAVLIWQLWTVDVICKVKGIIRVEWLLQFSGVEEIIDLCVKLHTDEMKNDHDLFKFNFIVIVCVYWFVLCYEGYLKLCTEKIKNHHDLFKF